MSDAGCLREPGNTGDVKTVWEVKKKVEEVVISSLAPSVPFKMPTGRTCKRNNSLNRRGAMVRYM